MSSLNKPKIKFFLATFFFAGSLWYFAPAFTGNLINPAMRIQIPNEYFQMFDWFNMQDYNGRIAILPINSFWNWTYYSWGYQGASFLQFGIPQPILDRDYDRWNPANEQYQREMSYAIYSQNPELISSVLTKFNVRWILFDNSVFAPGSIRGSTLSWLIPSLLQRTNGVTEKIHFGRDVIIYEVKGIMGNSQLSLYQNLPEIGPAMPGAPLDETYFTVGSYQTKADQNVEIDFSRGYLTKDERFNGPDFGNIVATVSASKTQPNPLAPCGEITGTETRGTVNQVIRYSSSGGSLCDNFNFPNLDHAKSYVFEVTSRNLEGFPLEICISNNLTRHCDLFTHLGKQTVLKTERFLLPELSDFGQGYTLNINNFAIKNQTSINELSDIAIEELPDSFMTQTSHGAFQSLALKLSSSSQQSAVNHPNPAYYKISFQPTAFSSQQNTLVLNQTFDDGWKAYAINTNNPIIQ